ncbi:predicted protein [Plenodomus lingam JN3]|uniref:Predicted protein n=1 Tax=Leptosphaeria maculans (strain JN3 / isolate v23.1.3 / race Av1-4-5-6-7-8) TaxID=985895 RepID=E5A2E4_LEPMJ|nr:predicted protein [Plenodomus lingam JN3]CBX97579.1 predicted protein [Plenodomus lingam JN3]
MIDARRRHASAFIDNGDHGRDTSANKRLVSFDPPQTIHRTTTDITLQSEDQSAVRNKHLLSRPSHPKRPQSLCAFSRAQILLTSSCSSFTELTIVSCYPGTGAPTETISDDWNRIPGARGYTPQACSSRDEMAKLHRLAVQHGLGLSEEHTPYQKDANTGCAFRRSNYSQMKTSSSLQH